jgi:transposase-like protein
VEQIFRALRHERLPDRADSRAGHYERKPETKAEEVTLRIPKLRRSPFEAAIVERYRRREVSVEEALVEITSQELVCGEWKTSPRHYGARG